ncbi:hypothetical protein DEA8626_01436 [Defluviimonas aquaemixtae]|uniref:J domain-containing protein n=1 Tax=Albidovulum aquaemixtae TaxID=1542388 RepID=A0A2R8B5J2_9RHOB|nr:hypothetical protein [Defluviimonas aquaemixtae]SPH17908.1 hypothetical protein DEA8626_01436 [Defluviimonas aquaemixtae]
MDTLFGIIVIWLIFCFVIAEFGPIIIELIGYLLCFLIECIVIALLAILKGVFFVLGWLFFRIVIAPLRFILHVMKSAILLGWFLIVELARGPPSEEDDEDDVDPDEPEDIDAAYGAACALLGFDPDGTPDGLKRAYRAMIRRAHPDAGGSAAQTIAVNEARELIRGFRGWN